MKNTLLFVFITISSFNVSGQSAENYFFFSQQDVENIRFSTNKAWGISIVDSLTRLVDNRLRYSMEVPMLEGGHSHQYFCPIHNIRLSFDWDKPTAHFCAQCNKEWTKEVKFNWAWVTHLHNRNHEFLNACAYLYIATNKSEYAEYIKELLLDYALKYPTYMLHDIRRKQVAFQSGKMYGQSLDEAVFASYAARAYLVAKPIMSADEVKQIEDGYLKPCAELLLSQKLNPNWSKPNWQVWHNSGMIALGVALANDSIINIALNDPVQGYHKLMELNVNQDGWWDEGSPTYHFYPLRAMLLSAEAVRCLGINLYDDKLYKMFASPALSVYANLQLPAHNDGWYGESLLSQARLYEIASIRFEKDFLNDILARVYQKSVRNTPEALQSNYDYTSRKFSTERQSVDFPHTGFSILCSGEKTVVLKYGPHGGPHGHPDKLSISIHDGRKEVVADLGTSAYGVPDFRRWYRRTLSHSTLSVDGKDQKWTTGKLNKFESNATGGSVEAFSDDAYEGVNIKRTLKLNKNKLTDIFIAESAQEHTYDWVLTLTGKPEFEVLSMPAELNESEVYQCIQNVQKITVEKDISFIVDGHHVTIKSLTTAGFDVFWGEAPGIPYDKLLYDKGIHSQPVAYSLIVRTFNEDLKLETIWNFR